MKNTNIVKKSDVLRAYWEALQGENYAADEREGYFQAAKDDIAFIEVLIPQLMGLTVHLTEIEIIDDTKEGFRIDPVQFVADLENRLAFKTAIRDYMVEQLNFVTDDARASILEMIAALEIELVNRKIVVEAEKAKLAVRIQTAKEKFVEMDIEVSVHADFFKRYRETVSELAGLIGAGSHFQDTAGTVYVCREIKGRYVDFTGLGIERTRRAEETKGTLSLDDAEKLGYTVERKRAKSKTEGAK